MTAHFIVPFFAAAILLAASAAAVLIVSPVMAGQPPMTSADLVIDADAPFLADIARH